MCRELSVTAALVATLLRMLKSWLHPRHVRPAARSTVTTRPPEEIQRYVIIEALALVRDRTTEGGAPSSFCRVYSRHAPAIMRSSGRAGYSPATTLRQAIQPREIVSRYPRGNKV